MTLVYVYGSGECEQLGKSDLINSIYRIQPLQRSQSQLCSSVLNPKFLTFITFAGLGDDQPLSIKKPRKPAIFDIGPGFPARQIVKIECGGMHTVALASDGSIYTWGCNDEKALGRKGAENVPLKVEFDDFKAEHISAGDCHTIAYNTQSNQLYYWGCYKVSIRLMPNLNFIVMLCMI